jgi:peptide/nickel transport system permease protein
MMRYLAGRALALAVTFVLAALAVFAVLDLLPGDPARIMLGIGATDDALAALRHELGLDRPAHARLLGWLGDLARGDLGVSHTYGVPVGSLVLDRLAVTAPLAVLALALTVALGVPAGVAAAARHGRATDVMILAASQIGLAVPGFWLGILLILAFGVGLGWLPAGGFPGWRENPGGALAALVLPAFALALAQGAVLARITRAAVLETLDEDYTRTALAKGMGRARLLWRHALPNALVPVLTLIGLQFTFLISGAIVLETVFTLPGLGRLVLQAVTQRDLVVVRGVIMILVVCAVLIAFAVDALHAALDPRLRVEGQP